MQPNVMRFHWNFANSATWLQYVALFTQKRATSASDSCHFLDSKVTLPKSFRHRVGNLKFYQLNYLNCQYSEDFFKLAVPTWRVLQPSYLTDLVTLNGMSFERTPFLLRLTLHILLENSSIENLPIESLLKRALRVRVGRVYSVQHFSDQLTDQLGIQVQELSRSELTNFNLETVEAVLSGSLSFNLDFVQQTAWVISKESPHILAIWTSDSEAIRFS